MIALLPPLPVAGPLVLAGLLLAFGHFLPRRVPDVVAIATCLITAALCVMLVTRAAHGPLVYWFGGWTPRPDVTLGIGFSIDQAGAIMAAFIAFLFALTMVFAWGLFADTHEHFHVLMLLFMTGMIGFCLTHDLFNMFVWFELMSVAGFALTASMLRLSALAGALNFTIMNTVGAYLILSGIGLVYSRAGALDFSALARGLAPDDPVALAGFALLASGLLIKAAQVPFHFWLADAHAVAPSPVSVIFSGAMVSIALFGIGRLLWPVYANSPGVHLWAHGLLMGMGCASALIGGVMALLQRHLKRLLAFSTIAHAGIMLLGIATLSVQGLAGALTYMLGHGLVKGSLFMLAGILLSQCGGIDEIGLRGKGKQIPAAGIAMGIAALLLGGAPIGLLDIGTNGIAAACPTWAVPCLILGIGCTGAACLRAAARIFLGWGKDDGLEANAPTEDEKEPRDRPLWLMLLPVCIMLACAFLPLEAAMHHAAAQFSAGAAATAEAPTREWAGWTAFALSLSIAALQLAPAMPRPLATPLRHASHGLEGVHSGLIGDYLAWMAVGLLLFALAAALG